MLNILNQYPFKKEKDISLNNISAFIKILNDSYMEYETISDSEYTQVKLKPNSPFELIFSFSNRNISAPLLSIDICHETKNHYDDFDFEWISPVEDALHVDI